MSNKSKKSAENGPAASDDSNSNLDSNRPTSSSSGSTPATQPRQRPDGGAAEVHTVKDGEKKKKEPGTKTMWVTVFKCFHCGKHGHNLPKCRQCSQAYYCNADCQRKHWKKHKPVCRATVAALANHAHRQRVARAVREKDNVEEDTKEEDKLCVICQDRPVHPVQVSE